jgi:putative ABC transport system substrate-binding protein
LGSSHLSRVAALWDPGFPGGRLIVSEAEAAARALGVGLHLLGVRGPGELDGAWATIIRERAGAVLVVGGSLLASIHRVAELAVKHRLPTMCFAREYVEAGCLMSYGLHYTDQFERAAYFVDRILKGAKPADLPVEQPTKFELVINLKTAKPLGLTIPPSVLARADEVIQ